MSSGRRLHRSTVKPHPAILITIAVILFVVVIVSWNTLGLSLQTVNWFFIALSALLVPVSLLLTAAEYRLVGAANGVEVAWGNATMITIIGSVANLLPLPGAAAVRVNDLIARDATPSHATRATVGIGVLWLGWALVLSGGGLLMADSWIIGLALFAAGTATVVTSWLIAPPRTPDGFGGWQWFTTGSILELTALVVGSLRIWLTLLALGTTATLLQSVGLVAAGAISSSIGIVPGGLGVRELIAGLLAPLVGLEIAAAILTVAVVRMVGLAIQAPIALMIARTQSQHV
ncbi:MAG: hypothetical protein ABFR53_09220 [Actinomycetota bacterium]